MPAGLTPSVLTFNPLLDGLHVNGNNAEAEALLGEASQRGVYGTPTQYTVHLASLDIQGMSRGAAITALRVWLRGLCDRAVDGEQLPGMLQVTGLAAVRHGSPSREQQLQQGVEGLLVELGSPFTVLPEGGVRIFRAETTPEVYTWLRDLKSHYSPISTAPNDLLADTRNA
ncbi:hypothetical protein CYMTET_25249 [Cymbomonas tetramitiformis]|uniref:Uncharacterized protein n=1 Tax=Cymbomonas tetramitiformis TaxID=36881 RepID=A0AAE0KZF0_9CHLO|nr:hypothetical protein CYMTET_25249 [Cymbomonas tetramitiformis]